MGTDDERSQESPLTYEQAAEIIYKLYQQADLKAELKIEGSSLRIDPEGREALRLSRECILKAIQRPAIKTTIFEGLQAEKLKAQGLRNFETRKCPFCNWIVAKRQIGNISVQNFCEHCGQALKLENSRIE